MASVLRLASHGVVVTGRNRVVQAGVRSSRRNLSLMDPVINKKSNMPELHKKFNQFPHLVGADNPTFLKDGMSDKIVIGVATILISTGIISVSSGLVHMANGTNVLEIV